MTAVVVPRGTSIEDVALELIDVGDNVRVNVTELEELAASIREHGVLQPVKVVPAGDRFRLVWGQRRVLASRLAERITIPAIVEASSSEGSARSIEQLVENLHRADLNAVDRARAIRAVVDSGVSQADLARQLGIAPSTVSNDLRLLTLDDQVLERIVAGEITAAHGKAIASLPAKQQKELARAVVEEKLSAHRLEDRIKWKTDEATQDAARTERSTKWIPKVIKVLEDAGVPKDAEVYLSANTYNFDGQVLEDAVRAAGWTNLSHRYHFDRGPKCDCTAVRVLFDGRAPVVVPVCANDAHKPKDRAAGQRDRTYVAQQAAIKALPSELVVWHIPDGQGNGVGFNPLAARILLIRMLGWSAQDLPKRYGDDPKATPWVCIKAMSDEDVAKELGAALVAGLGYLGGAIDWIELAKELGVKVPAK